MTSTTETRSVKPSTDHTMKMATKVTTPKATESRNDVFITDHGSTRVSRSRARRGWRPGARRARLPRDPAGPALARCSSAALDSVSWSRSVRDRLLGSPPEVRRGVAVRSDMGHSLLGLVGGGIGRCFDSVLTIDCCIVDHVGRFDGGLTGACLDLGGGLGSLLLDLLVLTRLDRAGHHGDRVALLGRHELHTLAVAAGGPEVGVDRAADDLPAAGDREHLVALLHDERADQAAAVLVGELDRADADTAAVGGAVVGDARALGEAAVGDGEDVLLLHLAVLDGGAGLLDRLLRRDLVGPDHGEGEHRVVVVLELHPAYAAGGAAHRAQLLVAGLEADRLALAGHEQDVVVGVDQAGAGGEHEVGG